LIGLNNGNWEITGLTDLSELRFYQTIAHDCGYLPGRQATNIFVDPSQQLDPDAFSFLSGFGFRRSGSYVYKPRCSNCSACIPVRVAIREFHPSRSQKRCLKRNMDLKLSMEKSIDTDECYSLYERYISSRHSDGEMYPPTQEQYREFLGDALGITEYPCYRDKAGNLISVAVTDKLNDGLSAMYSFFDPEENKRSLGMFNILQQINLTKTRGLPYLYLGYWIKNSRKMAYKSQYQPLELLINNHWMKFSDFQTG
jgi:arginine-tRNA-protein transferase